MFLGWVVLDGYLTRIMQFSTTTALILISILAEFAFFFFLLNLQRAGDHNGYIFMGECMFTYLCDCSQLYTPSCALRSASDTISLQIPRTRLSIVGSRAFSFFGPSTWNDLPLPLRQKPSLNETSRHFISQNYRPTMFSVLCCCFHPSQISVRCPF